MKKTIKIDLPIHQPSEIETLAEVLIKHHKELGDNSPLNNAKVEVFEGLSKLQKEKRAEYYELMAKAETVMQESKTAMGTAEGQNSTTPNTMYYYLTMFRDMLLAEYKGREEELNKFGYKTVIGTAKTPVNSN